ncbi:MAG: hypothetical protein P1U39_04170 [Legionellaceae bacterium]|nr:hypothetical protein [Legionellaceae bacterium]
MNVPDGFYYRETQSSIEYRRTPTGALEIKELIAGNACWIPATLPRIQKPKSLVLADWTAKTWSHDKIERVIKSLAYLMNQGFSLYLWRDGHVFSMTRQDLSKLSSPHVRYEMRLAAADVVRDVAVKEQKLSFDQVHVMDDYWLDCILSNNDVPGPRVLRVSDATKLSDEALDDVIEVLTKATPPLTLMLHDEFSLKSNEKAHQLKQKQTLAHIDYEVSYHKADAFRLSIEDMLEAVTLDGMPKLEVLSLSKKKLPKEHLETLIEACPDLQSLNLSDFTNLDQDILFEYGLRKLRELNLSYSNISPTNLIHFLNCARKLHALNLSWCSTFIKPFNIKINHLRNLGNLRTLNLLGSQISLDNLHALLASAKHLRTLNLGFCENIRSPLDIDWACFRGLSSLDISELDLSLEDLNAWFAATPQLHTLNIRGCYNLDECFQFEPMSLDALRCLDLSSTDLVIEDLSEFLLAAPKLHTLMLSACTWLDDELEWEAGSLPYLRTLDVKGSSISKQNINIFLAAAPHLDQASKNSLMVLLQRQEENTPSTPLPAPEQLVLTNPTHDSKQQQDFKPTAPDEVFEFKGTNQTKNQGMIIEKLSQYLTQKNQHLAVIPKIQDGMCNALSHYFLDLEQASWDEFVNLAQKWNGGEEISGALSSHFEALYTYVQEYQMHQQAIKYYLGDELKAYLDTKRPCILLNPWHAIALKPTHQGTWQVYDPNYVIGWQEISQNELLETLHTAIGSIVSVEGDRATYALGIHHPDEFMEHGGLLALCGCVNAEAMLAELPQDYTYSD